MITSKHGILFSERLLRALGSARRVAVLTGAGVSAESGVETFRGGEGLWKKLRPEELSSFEAFVRNPDIVWEWYRHRQKLIANVKPNPGHYALAELERLFERFALITQNIDNLHRRAGSRTVHELHGNIERNLCVSCSRRFDTADIVQIEGLPKCNSCGGLIRPDVVWFGELLPAEEWAEAENAARNAEVFLSIGTSGVVYPAASLPLVAHRSGAFLVEINPEPTALTQAADEFLAGKSGEILPQLVSALSAQRSG